MGFPGNTVVGKASREVFSVDEPDALALYSRVAATGTPARVEFWYPPMKKYPLDLGLFPDERRFATVFEDITQRKENEAELRAAYEQITAVEEELRNNFDGPCGTGVSLCGPARRSTAGIVETAYEGILAIDADMKITFVNPRLAEMSGTGRRK